MKWTLIGLGAALAAAAAAVGIAAARQKTAKQNRDSVDGGVVKRCWADAPKVIESTEIVTFHSEISLLAACDTGELGNRVYRLDAAREEDGVRVSFSWYDRHGGSDRGEYTADADFMVRLQEIAASHDFARHNGYYHTVSGLPAMYGESLHIVYASGERIDVHDNQSGFLSLDAEKALILLFGAATKPETK